MKTLSILVVTLVGIAASGCTAPEIHIAPTTKVPGWQDTGTPPPSVVQLDSPARYYKDETGATRDDHGKRVSLAP